MKSIMTKACAFVVAVVLATAGVPTCPTAQAGQHEQQATAACAPIPQDESAYVEGELLVTLDEGAQSTAQSTADAISDNIDCVDAAEAIEQPDNQAGVMQVELADSADMLQAQAEIAATPGVASVQPNYRYHELEASALSVSVADTYADTQYYLKSFDESFGINAKAAWEKVRCGTSKANSKVTVAVLDSGFKLNHEDLKDNILDSYAYDVTRNAEITATATANPAHGTHVAGIISASANNAKGIAGVSYNAKIVPVKVFTNAGTCTSLALRKAYSYLLDLVASGELNDLHVINMSLGSYGGSDYILEASIKKARNEYDIVTVCAGGNGYDSDEAPSIEVTGTARREKIFPADLDACVSVTALTKSGANAEWSDYNEYKDISAPGVGIVSTYSNGGYATGSGTSMAAPVVSGALALMWAKNPDLTVDQALEALYETAVGIVQTENSRAGQTGSRGCVDIAAALDYLDGLVSLKGSKVTVSNATFNGKAKTPKPTVVLGGKKLKLGTDYKLNYTNNVNAGTARVYVKGIGDYTGVVWKSFKIVLPAKVKKVKKAKVKGFKLSLTAPQKIRATYKKVAKATGYQIKYKKAKAKKRKAKKVKKLKWTSGRLKASSRYFVKVRPYIKYGGKVFYGKWTLVHSIHTK